MGRQALDVEHGEDRGQLSTRSVAKQGPGRRSARGRSCRTACSTSRTRCGLSSETTPLRPASNASPAVKSLISGTCAKTLLATTRSACPRRATMSSAVSRPKKRTSVGTPLPGALGDVGGGLDAQARDAHGDKIAQQVAVVGGHLHHETVGRERQATRHFQGEAACVVEPARRDGGEIGVVAEDGAGVGHMVELRQPTRAADADRQGKARLGLPRLVGRDEAVGHRLLSEVAERDGERPAAEAATGDPLRRHA